MVYGGYLLRLQRLIGDEVVQRLKTEDLERCHAMGGFATPVGGTCLSGWVGRRTFSGRGWCMMELRVSRPLLSAPRAMGAPCLHNCPPPHHQHHHNLHHHNHNHRHLISPSRAYVPLSTHRPHALRTAQRPRPTCPPCTAAFPPSCTSCGRTPPPGRPPSASRWSAGRRARCRTTPCSSARRRRRRSSARRRTGAWAGGTTAASSGTGREGGRGAGRGAGRGVGRRAGRGAGMKGRAVYTKRSFILRGRGRDWGCGCAGRGRGRPWVWVFTCVVYAWAAGRAGGRAGGPEGSANRTQAVMPNRGIVCDRS